jgi:chromate transporter
MSSPAFPDSTQQSAALPASTTTQPQPAPRPTISELFVAFAAISLSGFGGVLAWARRKMVEERHWLTAE